MLSLGKVGIKFRKTWEKFGLTLGRVSNQKIKLHLYYETKVT